MPTAASGSMPMAASPPSEGAAAPAARAFWHLFLAPLRVRPGRTLLSLLAIALGVALATAVAIIHRSAQAGFAEGLRSVGGGADLEVIGGRDEVPLAVYADLLASPDIAWVTPVIERELRLTGGGSLALIGVDTVALPGAFAPSAPTTSGSQSGVAAGTDAPPPPGAGVSGGLLRPDTMLLSAEAARALGRQVGERVSVVTERGPQELEIIGVLSAAFTDRRLAIADVAAVHDLFGLPGRVSRLELRLAARDADARAAWTAALSTRLPPGVLLRTPEHALAAADRLSRAYRINLSMLALMALLTGAFLVFAVQAAAMLRRRRELALLRALGMSRRTLFRGLLLEGAAVGLTGSLLGVLVGIAGAAALLHWTGGDLGAGYYAGTSARLTIGMLEWMPYVGLGVVAALAGAWLPAAAAVRADPAQALRAGDAEASLRGFHTRVPAGACAVAGAVALFAPPADDVPWGGYLAIGLWLTAAVLALPVFARWLWWRLPLPRPVYAALALGQLRGAARLVTIGAGGVLAATAVAAAMAIMVHSFRTSVDHWLNGVLAADVYLRAGRVQTGLGFDDDARRQIAGHPAVRAAQFVRYRSVLLDPQHPAVTLIARPLAGPPAPAITSGLAAPPGMPAVWASEAMADLYGWAPGRHVRLPLAGAMQEVFVAGLWRDYVRSHGAFIIDLAAYQAISGDLRIDEVGLLLHDQDSADALMDELRRLLPIGPWLEIESRQDVRARSLAIFDRTFAATYALELAALVIGLAGVAASFAAQANGRLREFGVLRHLGLSRRDLQRMVATEAAAVAVVGLAVGLIVAFAVAVVLIEVVNRQAFHWSMDLKVPWRGLAALVLSMLAATLIAALLATRRALGADGVRAVREDW